MNFKDKYYYQVKFDKLISEKEIIGGVEFEDCEFVNCSFVETKFIKCKFITCRYIGCVLSATTPTDSHFVETSFSNSKVIGMDWTKAQRLQDISFDNCQINYSNFRLLKLQKIKIINCEAKETDFTEADLSEGNFTNTDFEKSLFLNTNLSKANFLNAKNYYIDVRCNNIKKAHFSTPEAISLLDSLNIVLD